MQEVKEVITNKTKINDVNFIQWLIVVANIVFDLETKTLNLYYYD